jgi:hypothetical protein
MSYVQIGNCFINTASIAYIKEHGKYLDGIEPTRATIFFTGGAYLELICREAEQALSIAKQDQDAT